MHSLGSKKLSAVFIQKKTDQHDSVENRPNEEKTLFTFLAKKFSLDSLKTENQKKRNFIFRGLLRKKNLSPSFKLLWRKKENRAWGISRTTLSATKTMKNNFFIGNESLPRREKSETGVLKEKITTVIGIGSRQQR